MWFSNHPDRKDQGPASVLDRQLEASCLPSALLQIVLMVSFSSRTTSLDIQRNLEANVEKRTKDTYGPPMGKRLLVFMDDMNMPKVGGAYRDGIGLCVCVCVNV